MSVFAVWGLVGGVSIAIPHRHTRKTYRGMQSTFPDSLRFMWDNEHKKKSFLNKKKKNFVEKIFSIYETI